MPQLKVNEKNINYEIEGNGTPFVFVHGWGGSIKSLEALAKLASSKYTAIRIELPGFGQSDNPDETWGITEYAENLIATIKQICEHHHLYTEQLSYFGHSFGGALGVYIASTYPDFIKKMVLCGASFKRTHTAPFQPVSKFKKLITPLRKIYYKLLHPKSEALKFAHLENNFRRIVTTDLTPSLENIIADTTVLWGADDRETPVEHVEILRNGLKNAKTLQVEIFPETGHNLPLARPDIVWEKI